MAPKADTSKIDVIVGEQLVKLRKKQDLNQTQVGELLGVSYQQIQKYETGKSRLGTSRLMKLSETFNIPMAYFFSSQKPLVESNNKDFSTIEKETLQLITSFYAIKDKSLKHSLLEIAQEFAQNSKTVQSNH